MLHAMFGRAMFQGAMMMGDGNDDGEVYGGEAAAAARVTPEMEAFMQGGANKPKIPHHVVLESLVRVRVQKDHPPGDPCPVCQDVPVEGQETLQLPCDHTFHSDCLKPWFAEHNSCPVCRSELPTADDLE
jgi:hypothetical protein